MTDGGLIRIILTIQVPRKGDCYGMKHFFVTAMMMPKSMRCAMSGDMLFRVSVCRRILPL